MIVCIIVIITLIIIVILAVDVDNHHIFIYICTDIFLFVLRLPVTSTTRNITCLVESPRNLHLPLLLGRGSIPKYAYVSNIYIYIFIDS